MAYVDNPNGFVCVGTLNGGPAPEPMYARLDVNQTISRGDMLIASGGYLQIAAASSVVLIGVAVESIVASASVYKWVGFIPALPHVLFEGQCSGTATIADLWTVCDIEGTTGIMEINEDATSYGVIAPVALSNETEGFGTGAGTRLKFMVQKSLWNISA